MRTSFWILVFHLCAVAALGQSMFDKVNDFDGDGKADLAVTRNVDGLKVWHIWNTTSGYRSLQWGLADDFVVAGDYDGDGRSDIAVGRLGSFGNEFVNTTYYLTSANSTYGFAQVRMLSMIGSLSFPNEDYDGDGKTDAAIFQWHGIGAVYYKSSLTGTTNPQTIGWFQVRVGDVGGNAAADIASYDPGRAEITVAGRTLQWGNTADRWVVADFDGDNKGEIAIFRPSTGDWWWIRSSDSVVNVGHWGLNGDTPVPADYDGDGRTDLAVYRPGSPNSTFYVYGSTAGVSIYTFGLSTDSAVTY